MKALILILTGIILTTITTTQIDPQNGLFIPILVFSVCILGRGVYEAVQEPKPTKKDLTFWRENAQEDYLTTPISVLAYITVLERVAGIEQTAQKD